jgi:hypothetical protein
MQGSFLPLNVQTVQVYGGPAEGKGHHDREA